MTSEISFTVVDQQGDRYLILPVAVVQDAAAAADDSRWCAYVCDPASPLAGLYAFAPHLGAVREAIARTAWAAVAAGELSMFRVSTKTLCGIYVVATTCDVYDAAVLAVANAGDAA